MSENAKTFQAMERTLSNHTSLNRFTMKEKRKESNLKEAPKRGEDFNRIVAGVKKSLQKAHGRDGLNHYELLTLVVEIEVTLSSRPLTYEYNETRKC